MSPDGGGDAATSGTASTPSDARNGRLKNRMYPSQQWLTTNTSQSPNIRFTGRPRELTGGPGDGSRVRRRVHIAPLGSPGVFPIAAPVPYASDGATGNVLGVVNFNCE